MDRPHRSTVDRAVIVGSLFPPHTADEVPDTPADVPLRIGDTRPINRRSELTFGVHLAGWTGPAHEPVLLVVRRDRTLVGHMPWIVPPEVLEATIQHAWDILEALDGKAA